MVKLIDGDAYDASSLLFTGSCVLLYSWADI